MVGRWVGGSMVNGFNTTLLDYTRIYKIIIFSYAVMQVHLFQSLDFNILNIIQLYWPILD